MNIEFSVIITTHLKPCCLTSRFIHFSPPFFAGTTGRLPGYILVFVSYGDRIITNANIMDQLNKDYTRGESARTGCILPAAKRG